MGIFRRYGFLWLTLVLLLGSVIGHWTFGWFAFVEEQRQHIQSPQFGQFVIEASRDTLENWQSEFLQLICAIVRLLVNNCLFAVIRPSQLASR
jgi:hypothetical protein